MSPLLLQDKASQMVIFDVLIEAGSFSEAAKRLNVSTSYVSKQISQLEVELGIKLVQRTTRSLVLTEEGRQFHQFTSKITGTVRDALDCMATQKNEVSGRIRIGVSQSFGSIHIIPAIKLFREKHPDLHVELSLFDHKADMLADGLDLWITNYEMIPEGYVAQRLADVRFVVAASPKYLIEHQAPATPKDLKTHNCLTYYSRHRDYSQWQFVKEGEAMTFSVSGNYRVDLAEAVRDGAVAGWGIAYLATYLLTDEFRNGKLIQLMPEWQPAQKMPFYAVYPSRQHLPRKVTEVIDFIKSYIGGEPYWDKNLKPHVHLGD